MIQKTIKLHNGTALTVTEAAEGWKELDDRTKSSKAGLNSIDEIAEILEPISNGIVNHNYGGDTPVENNPTEGRGHADNVLFDLTKYFESKSNGLTGANYGGFSSSKKPETSDFLNVDSQMFAGVKTLQTSRNLEVYSNHIPVKPGEKVYGEIFAKHISGSTDRTVYFGLQQFDKDLKPVSGNNGTTYPFAADRNPATGNWEKYSGYYVIPTSHTPYNGSDGGGVCYVRVRILLNYSSDGSAVRQFGGIILKRADINHNIDVKGDVTCVNLIQTSDKKYKKNIEEIDGEWALEVFKKLNFSFYDFSLTNNKQAGLIAQEVEKILPQAVHTSENGDKGLNHTYIDMVCKAGIQHFIKTQIQ